MSYKTVYYSPIIFSQKINSLGIQTLENPDVANKIQRAKENIDALNNDFYSVVRFISRIFLLMSTLFVVLKIMPIIALIITITVIPDLVFTRIYNKKIWKIIYDTTENSRRSYSITSDLSETSYLREITISSSFNFLMNKVRLVSDYIYNKQKNNFLKDNIYSFIFGSLTKFASIFGYFFILRNVFYKIISIGDATFQFRSLDLFVANLSELSLSFGNMSERMIRVNEIKQVFDMKSIVEDGKVELDKSENAPIITFKNVDFKYPRSENYVIKNLNLEIKPGEKIAIVGKNGSGKTTLIKLLSRFYKITDGSICLNNININDLLIASWYKKLGVLFQDYNKYSYLTLNENIEIGRTDISLDQEKIKEAIKQADVDSFSKKYKNEYEQILSEKYKGGTNPSEGQWQKIAIARFFYRNSPVVVFDEPTSSIDALSEAEIFDKIYKFFKDKTVIIISHRFSTVRMADRIIVIDEGKVKESGTHDELMKIKGEYANMFNIQAKGYK
jgi:ABC-type multidrug transport system fused ATPase/permease subunit